MSDEIDLMEDVADRLISERVRLGYSKADFAREIDITRNTLRTYEAAQSNIPSNILIRMGSIGIDVMYVLFNQKNRTQIDTFAEKVRQQGEKQAEKIVHASNVHNSVIAGNGSTVNNIHTTHHTTKTKAEVKPGIEHITDEQAAEIKRLVDDIVVIEGSGVKKNPRTHQAVWSALNRRMKIPSYRLMRIEQFENARDYLRSTIGRLMSQKNARKKVPKNEWRKRKYRYIHASFKEVPELEAWFENHLLTEYKVSSEEDLSDDELEKAYSSVSNKKRELKKRTSS